MTEAFNKNRKYKVDHSTFGGIIYLSDFDTNNSTSRNIAQRIVNDKNFDEQCRRIIRNRNNIGGMKNEESN